MPPPPTRLANLVKCRSLNILRWSSSVRCLAYTTCSHLPSVSSSDTSVLCQPLGKFTVNVTLDQRKRERSNTAALLFGRHLKESGFKNDVETYMAIVRLLLSHSCMDVRLYNLFMYGIENVGFEISHLLEALLEEKLIKAVDVLVKVYASVGRFDEAIDTVSQMKSRSGLMVSTQTCNFIINELIEWDKVDMVESVYRQLKRNGLIPNVYTYEILFKVHVLKPHLKETKDVVDQMESAGIAPNAFMIGTFIHRLCLIGRADVAFETLKKLRESKYTKTVNAYAYGCVIRGFVDQWKLKDAENAFLDMKEVVPDADCYGAILRGYRKSGEIGKALDLSEEIESIGIRSDYSVARSMMQTLVGLGNLAEILDLFKFFMENEFLLDGALFNIAIDAACKLGRMEDALRLMEGMKSARKMKPRKMHYRTLMRGFCFRGEPWNALNIFQEMMRNGFTPDSADYHVLARGGVHLPLYMIFK